jgi:hypothetical protein
MKKLILLALLVFLSNVNFAQNAGDKPYFIKRFKTSEIKNLAVNTSGGSILVEGLQDNEVLVEVYIKGNNGNKDLDKEEIEERLKAYLVSVQQNGDKLDCIAKSKEKNMNWKKSLSVSFKIYGPKEINTSLNTSGGSISLFNLKGNLEFNTSGGSLSCTGLYGKIMGRTSGGSISISNCHDNMDLSTSGGSISAKNVTGKIGLRTSGGSLNLENMRGNIYATTSGGSVDASHISGEFITSTSGGSINLEDVGGNVKASTSGGGINATISTINDYLTLNASSGNISVDMPMSKGMDLDIHGQRVSSIKLNNFDGSIDKDSILGKINGGGSKVKISAGSGNISLNK